MSVGGRGVGSGSRDGCVECEKIVFKKKRLKIRVAVFRVSFHSNEDPRTRRGIEMSHTGL